MALDPLEYLELRATQGLLEDLDPKDLKDHLDHLAKMESLDSQG